MYKKVFWVLKRECNENNWFKKKTMKLLERKQQESYGKSKKTVLFVKKNVKIHIWKIENIVKL